MAYLDGTGLAYFWNKIKARIGLPTNAIVAFDGSTIPDGYEEVAGRAMITAKPSADKTYTSNAQYYSTKITDLTSVVSKTSKITINSSNQFVIGSGISYIKISANMNCAGGSTSATLGFQFVKTRSGVSTVINEGFMSSPSTYPFFDFALTPYLTSVQEGDLIELRIYFEDNAKNTTVRSRGTFITIEEA